MTNVYCITYDKCYRYKPDNKVYSYLSIYDKSFLVYKTKVAEAWTTNSTILWDNSDAYKFAGVAIEYLSAPYDFVRFPDMATFDICENQTCYMNVT